MIKRTIWVTFQMEGIHCYPEALTNPNLEDVKFLGYPHRHTFHFRVEVEVDHNNRDIEFIQLQRWCKSLYDGTLELNNKSCEMIAEELIYKLEERYGDRQYTVSVSEDNENGATLST